ncbi:unnamed protein product [Moneuplotes crassus]|uniref:Uncharacterized protein n=1 Tax=Euplotes crassus TaxID=5936 RepID=A0AAD1UNL4_EUPCR|nr:unnamed protein product [Moneuplotes crassus]
MFGNIDNQDYIMKRLGEEARKNLGIVVPFTDQTKLTSRIEKPKFRPEDTLDREIVKTERKYENIRTSPVSKTKPMMELESTGYQIDKEKFFGMQPNPERAFKKNSEEFYTGNGSPARIPSRNKILQRRSAVANTGNTIVRAPSHGSLSRISEKVYNPMTGAFIECGAKMDNRSYFRGRSNHTSSVPTLRPIKEANGKDDSSQLSYTSEILKKKKSIFGINSSTLKINLGTSSTNPSSGLMTRSLTHAPSTFKSPQENFNRSIKFERESEKYADASRQKQFKIINDQKYHRKNDLHTLTYNSISGKYYK